MKIVIEGTDKQINTIVLMLQGFGVTMEDENGNSLNNKKLSVSRNQDSIAEIEVEVSGDLLEPISGNVEQVDSIVEETTAPVAVASNSAETVVVSEGIEEVKEAEIINVKVEDQQVDEAVAPEETIKVKNKRTTK